MPFSAAQTRQQATALGFTEAGIIPAAPSPRLDAYLRWIEAGMHGTMGYLARPDRLARRRDLNAILPGARSLVVVALTYATNAVPPSMLRSGGAHHLRLGRGLSRDHDAAPGGACRLAARPIRAGVASRVYVDTGAISGARSRSGGGLGFTGKNTLLIHPRRGSYLFLGEVLTTLPFDAYDAPGRETLVDVRAARPPAHLSVPAPLRARRGAASAT